MPRAFITYFQQFLSIQFKCWLIIILAMLASSSHEKLIYRILVQLTKKAREAKAPSRCDDANECSNDGSASTSVDGDVSGKGSNIPQVTANMSMDSVDSTVDLSYASADTVDTNTSTDSAALTANVGRNASFDAQRQQQQRRRLIAAATAASGGAHGTTTSTHTHVTTASAFQAWSADGRGNRVATMASMCIAKEEVRTQRQQQEQRTGKRLICLISNGVADRVQAHRQLNALNILNVRQTPYEVVDGMDPDQRQRRDELFRISDIRGNYPQFFVERQVDNGYGGTKTKMEFWGSYERMEQLNEVDSLPPDVLLANPDVETWERVFGDCC